MSNFGRLKTHGFSGCVPMSVSIKRLPNKRLERTAEKRGRSAAGLADTGSSELPVRWCQECAPMITTVEAVIDDNGNVRLLEPLDIKSGQRAVVVIFDE